MMSLERFPRAEDTVLSGGSKGTGSQRSGLSEMNLSSIVSLRTIVESSEGSSSGEASEGYGSSTEEPGSRSSAPSKPCILDDLRRCQFHSHGGMANMLGARCDWRIVVQFRTIFSFMAAATLTGLAAQSSWSSGPKFSGSARSPAR